MKLEETPPLRMPFVMAGHASSACFPFPNLLGVSDVPPAKSFGLIEILRRHALEVLFRPVALRVIHQKRYRDCDQNQSQHAQGVPVVDRLEQVI